MIRPTVEIIKQGDRPYKMGKYNLGGIIECDVCHNDLAVILLHMELDKEYSDDQGMIYLCQKCLKHLYDQIKNCGINLEK